MKSKITITGALWLMLLHPVVHAQDPTDMPLPYEEIPEYPADYGPGNVLSRMIDGLGYRYFWATEGLRASDLQYRISADSRTTGETIDHIYDLSVAIHNAARNTPNVRPAARPELSFSATRRKTLHNLHNASELLKDKSAGDIASLKVKFQRDDQIREFPIWHVINGQIADAIYHTGQIVAFRRASGNPIDSRVNVFMGSNRK